MKTKHIGINSEKGFSLIELMVVVGIIGILASVAVPQFSKFQARARQSEVKGNLSALFSAEKAFFSEWTFYTADLLNAGFGIEGGALRYNLGFPAFGGGCTGYLPLNGKPPEMQVATNNTARAAAILAGSAFFQGLTPTAMAGDNCTQVAFVGMGYGDPNNAPLAALSDVWTINQIKTVSQLRNGIR